MAAMPITPWEPDPRLAALNERCTVQVEGLIALVREQAEIYVTYQEEDHPFPHHAQGVAADLLIERFHAGFERRVWKAEYDADRMPLLYVYSILSGARQIPVDKILGWTLVSVRPGLTLDTYGEYWSLVTKEIPESDEI